MPKSGRKHKSLPNDDRAAEEELIDIVNRKGHCHNYELRLKRMDGRPLWALVSTKSVMVDGNTTSLGGFTISRSAS